MYKMVINALNHKNTYSQIRENNKQADSLGKDQFLKILVAQLQNQDPLNPMDDREFIAQMAQFSTLEQITQLNSSMDHTKATGMIGKYAYAEYYDAGTGDMQSVYGKVEGMLNRYGNIYLQIDNKLVPLDSVLELYEKGEEIGDE